MNGSVIPKYFAYFSERHASSTGFTPAATTRTRIWSSFGSGRGLSSYFKTSGPPYSCTTIAFMVGLAGCPGETLGRIAADIIHMTNVSCLGTCITISTNRVADFFLRLRWPTVAFAKVADLLRLCFSVKGADPFFALVNPNASDVVGAGNVFAAGSRLYRRFIGNDSDLRVWEHHFHVCERVFAQISLCHIGKFGIQILHPFRVDPIIILGKERLERISLFIFVGFPRRLFQISDRRFVWTRFGRRFPWARLTEAHRGNYN